MNLKWQHRFLDLSNHVATWSKDPSTQVGAIIVDPDTKNIVSIGYNGFARGILDLKERYIDREFKYKLVVHAEANAIMSAEGNTRDKWLFINVPTCCNECMKLVIQSGINTIVMPKFTEEKFNDRWKESNEYSELMITEAKIKIIKI